MRHLFLILLLILPVGCYNTNIAWRGVIDTTTQKASTEGRIDNRPKAGDISINAEKQTDLKADVPITK